MEPLNEKELSQLLRKWQAPAAPLSLADRVLPRRKSWWRWLLAGTIRVPVPVGFAAIVLIGLWFFYFDTPPVAPARQPAASVSLADFQPVNRLEPIVVGVEK